MPNTINRISRNGAASVGTGLTPQQSARDASVTTTSGSQSDGAGDVHITGTASQLASLGEKLSSLPAIDPSRVERVSHALETGTYRILADTIASGLLQSEHALAQIESR